MESELYHYGVLDMKWGHRKAKNTSNKNSRKKTEWNKDYPKFNRYVDKHVWGKSGVKRINKRMNKGQSYSKAYAIEFGESMVKNTLLTIGGNVVAKVVVDKYIKSKTEKAINKIAQNHKFDPIDVPFKIIN